MCSSARQVPLLNRCIRTQQDATPARVTATGAGLSAGGAMVYSWESTTCTGVPLALYPKHSVRQASQS